MGRKEETFCFYCQKDYLTPVRLRRHLEKKHIGTYAFYKVNLNYAKGN